jgi:general stress protein 26
LTSARKLSDDAERLFEHLEKAKIGMLTTGGEPGAPIRSRPMTFLELDRDHMTVRMFTSAKSFKDEELKADPRANISVMDPAGQWFVSVSGLCTIRNEDDLKLRLWKPLHLAWFPRGVEDPTLRVLEFKIAGADFWDAPGGKVVQVFGIAKSILTGEVYRGGHHGHVGELH